MIEIETIIDAFESRHAKDGTADLAEFVPAKDHPEYAAAVIELIRVDLEIRREQGTSRSLDDYRSHYPDVLADPEKFRLVAYEEFRLRQQGGESVTADDYAQRYGIELPVNGTIASTSSSPSITDSEVRVKFEDPCHNLDPFLSGNFESFLQEWQEAFLREQPQIMRRLTSFAHDLPQVGQKFLDFDLICELGSGTFGKVYLARQAALANRLVVLKLISAGSVESQRLAQLQHTNIVPIYSVHRHPTYDAICMPFFGSTTLKDIVGALHQRESLPDRGKELFSTVVAHRDSTLLGGTAESTASVFLPGKPTGSLTETRRAETVSAEHHHQARDHLENRSYQDAILWIARKLAEGLAHAHDAGILHRDLKPANILFTDDGQPMLLDFNLSAEITPHGTAGALMGGTLAYMAPEHITALSLPATVDARSDLYSLGVMLFELLTGRLPFPLRSGNLTELSQAMIADRQGPVPSVRQWNPRISHGAEAIIQRCLDPDPKQRYLSAHELADDLQRQLDSFPLKHAPNRSLRERTKKWSVRHPRLSSMTVLGTFVLLFLCFGAVQWMIRDRRLKTFQANETFHQVQSEMPDATAALATTISDVRERDRAETHARRILAVYGVLESGDWTNHPDYRLLDDEKRVQLREGLTPLLFHLAESLRTSRPGKAEPDQPGKAGQRLSEALSINEKLQSLCEPHLVPRAALQQQATLLEQLGRKTEAEERRISLQERKPVGQLDRLLAAASQVADGDLRTARPVLKEMSNASPSDFSVLFQLGNCEFGLHHFHEAEACFTACLAVSPGSRQALLHRAVTRLQLKDSSGAERDFSAALQHDSDGLSALVGRALAFRGQKEIQRAIDDLTRALAVKNAPTRLYFLRSALWKELGKREQAEHDRQTGLKRTPNDAKSWVSRGIARLPKDPKGALEDFRQAKRLNPRLHEAYRDIAHVQAEYLKQPHAAIAALDQLLTFSADDPLAWSGRGVIHARLGNREKARFDAKRALSIRRDPLVVYQVAGIFALTSKKAPADADEAVELLAEALRKDAKLALLVNVDTDLDPIRSSEAFRKVVNAAATLRQFAKRVTAGR